MTNPPPAVSGAEPEPAPSLPGAALWSDSDTQSRPLPATALAGLVATPADRAMPTIGHIGRYALKYQLGEGGLGTVFAAHDPLLSRVIAVKTLNVEVKAEEREAFNALFLNEARAAGGLSHPHIVTVFDAGVSDDRAYIAMELLKGRDLRQLRQEGWRATPAQAALIARRVADALAFAHSKGVIHRDIKPANIFMVGRTQPRVLDFGIARVMHRHDGRDALASAGSPYYMAPEQIRGELADRRADVFSLGVVLYELLTDRRPFGGDSLDEITQAVLTHEPPLASKVDHGVPKSLADIVARAMAKDPERRFRSARSFARELRQWLDANPVDAEGAVTPVPPRRRRPLAWAAGLAVVAGLAAGAWLVGPLVETGLFAGATARAAPAVPMAAVAPASLSPVSPVGLPVVASVPTSVVVVAPPAASAAMLATEPAASVITDAAAPSLAALAEPVVTATPERPAAPAAATPHATLPSLVATSGATAATAPGKATASVPPSAAPTKESARERRAREAREQSSRESEARLAAAAAAKPVIGTGRVRIAISPWGQVEVDGNATGVAPPLTELTLPEGRHQIVVRNGDFAPFVASVMVAPGQTVSLSYKFGS